MSSAVGRRRGLGEHDGLTQREFEILRLVARGQANAEIAALLHIREQTVKNLVSVLFTKLHVSNRVQLAVLAVRQWPEILRDE